MRREMEEDQETFRGIVSLTTINDGRGIKPTFRDLKP